MDRFRALVHALSLEKEGDDGVVLLVFRFAMPFFFFFVVASFIVWFVLEVRTIVATRQRAQQPKAKKE